uniref:Uncharacterized protein n=1 Tax=Candidatus Kentrum sp. MB TaxID=2138164 RepID=A0A450X149_9GAMM|nr:MAG: hypothetical protein BECKMB1821G_GA0114241_100382 [Candidatus Kentron sp. MB]VFK26624.1 MAG: hypothetical protein BECKMB1821I_GA0114274_100168 [Candidatus Kentron sp. MB]
MNAIMECMRTRSLGLLWDDEYLVGMTISFSNLVTPWVALSW